MQTVHLVTKILIYIITGLCAYQIVYMIVGFFCKKKVYKTSDNFHTFAVIISARNEEKVIGNLIKSIRAQNYPQDKIKIFVVADNCTDNTADICRNLGATVYERFDKTKMRKGYAFEWLFERIEADFGIESVDGYIVFDADNILDADFVAKINNVYDDCDVVTGYRNTKNFDDNFISAACGIHFYETIVSQHRPREFFNTPTILQGTGYMVKSRFLADGWHHTTLTEDTEFTIQSVAKGMHIRFCEDAVFYDEQPTDFKTAIRQRLRWTKGRLVVFFKNCGKSIKGMFRGGFKNFWANFDIFMYCFPVQLYTALLTVIYPVTAFIVSMASGKGIALADVYQILYTMGTGLLSMYLRAVILGTCICIREKKSIICKTSKQVLYVLTWFWFDLLALPIAILCLFMRVEWKPIKHNADISIEQLNEKRESLNGDAALNTDDDGKAA